MIDSAVSTTGMRVLRLLVGNPPRTVTDLVDATGRTRTAVTAQLADLMAAGLVSRTSADSSGPGRPKHLYTATAAAKLLFQAYLDHPLSAELLKALTETGGTALAHQVLQRVCQSMAADLQEKITGRDPVGRLQELARWLKAQGVLAEVQQTGGRWMMRERTCPFSALVDLAPGICRLEQELFSLVVGADLQLVDCTRQGGVSCAFALSAARAASDSTHPQSL